MANPHDNYAHRYEEIYQQAYGPHYDNLTATHIQSLMNLSQNVKSRFLDIGAGTGRLAIPLAKKGFSITAVEPSEGMLLELNKNITKHNVNVLTYNAIQDIPETESYDLAFSLFTVINYVTTNDELKSLFTNTIKLLKPGANFLFDFSDNLMLYNSLPSINNVDFKRKIKVDHDFEKIYTYFEDVSLSSPNESFQIKIQLREWKTNEVVEIGNAAGYSLRNNIPITPNHVGLCFYKN